MTCARWAARRAARAAACWLVAGVVGGAAPASLRAQHAPPPPAEPKRVHAVRIRGADAPRLDGKLDDAVWQQAEFVSDFRQRDPDEGAIPGERTEVALLYDDDALYVGARMHSAHPSRILAPLTRRDHAGNAEQFLISLDTYLDRRTAYTFGLTAGGVRLDYYQREDDEHARDYSFDPVWEGRATVDSGGWSAEMRIPFTQLRFNSAAAQAWGVQLRRRIPARNEDDFWVLIPKVETGWASRFGTLVGIEGIRPARGAELVPYAAGRATFRGRRDPADPFGGNELGTHAGGDLKVGLGPNLTLEATVNPDFGQVEADPAEVNLSAFERFFSERRPFFTEGRSLLEGEGPSYFYSRRIGAAPHGRASGDFVDQPNSTTILGAGKLTGRLSSGLSIGALGALTDREYARTADAAALGRALVEPRTGFGVLRAQQQFGASGSTAGVMLTGVHRTLSAGEPLAATLDRAAYSGGTDWNLRFRGGAYVVSGYGGFSYIAGEPAAIVRAQRSSARYFQRPDAAYVSVDSARTSLAGYTAAVNVSKTAGRHWLWDAAGVTRSPEFELNDAGRLTTADDIRATSALRYRETRPRRLLREYTLGVSTLDEWNFGGVHRLSSPQISAGGTWRNYWYSSLKLTARAAGMSDKLTRGGPLMGTAAGWELKSELATDPAQTAWWDVISSVRRDDAGGWGYSAGGTWSLRGRERWEIGVEPRYSRGVDARQYVTSRSGGRSATFGRRYVFAFVDRGELAARCRVRYAFTPDLALDLTAEPFAASGRFFDYGELDAARSRTLRRYDGSDGARIARTADGSLQVTDGPASFTLHGDDFNVRSLRSTVVARWEWRPGSTAFLIWQQDLSAETTQGRMVRPAALWEALSARGDNILALKVSYWVALH